MTNKKQQRQIAYAMKMAALGEVIEGVSHEFNNVLGVVVGNLQLMTQIYGDEFGEDMSSMMADALFAANRGVQLTSSLRILSQPQSRHPVLTDANEVVENFANLISDLLDGNISVQTRLADNLEKVYVEPDGLNCALLHLAINARDAMPDGGTMTLITGGGDLADGTSDTDNPAGARRCVVIDLEDTGCGMSADVRDRATDAFFTTKCLDKGGGLGLSVVSDFVTSAEGDLRISSAPGAGTTIAIYLPVQSPDA